MQNLVASKEVEPRFDGKVSTRPVSVRAEVLTFGQDLPVDTQDTDVRYDGLALAEIIEREFTAKDGHALSLTACKGALMCDVTTYGNNSEAYGTNYGVCMDYCEAVKVFRHSGMNARLGLCIATCDWVIVEDATFAQCNTGVSVRNGSTNARLLRVRGNPIVIGNTQWTRPPRHVHVHHCEVEKIEIQGAAEDVRVDDCDVLGPILFCQIYDALTQNLYSPKGVVIDDATRYRSIGYYTVNSLGNPINMHWAGDVTVGGEAWKAVGA